MQRTQSTAVHFVCSQKKSASASILLMTLHNSRRTAEESKKLELRHRFWILIPSQNMDRVIHFGQFKGARKKKPFPDIRHPYGTISGSSISCQNVGKISTKHHGIIKKSRYVSSRLEITLNVGKSPSDLTYNHPERWRAAKRRHGIITQNGGKSPPDFTILPKMLVNLHQTSRYYTKCW